jgi:hypothetical protein
MVSVKTFKFTGTTPATSYHATTYTVPPLRQWKIVNYVNLTGGVYNLAINGVSIGVPGFSNPLYLGSGDVLGIYNANGVSTSTAVTIFIIEQVADDYIGNIADAVTLEGNDAAFFQDAGNLNAGTVAPARMDYDSAIDYAINNFTTENGIPYRAIQANGPSTVVKSPAANPDYWEVVGGGGSGQVNFKKYFEIG